ncbi:hypothetical protein K0M31_010881 [Melipona bicolor]|uniref:Uncharacterized protein n=1 Tax=Melipona bicolor TaxID=60889 RepID=A0AA40FLZ3_9HYME|nr:hypothetical protein K0M31_010881 [Melipona bicolor]
MIRTTNGPRKKGRREAGLAFAPSQNGGLESTPRATIFWSHPTSTNFHEVHEKRFYRKSPLLLPVVKRVASTGRGPTSNPLRSFLIFVSWRRLNRRLTRRRRRRRLQRSRATNNMQVEEGVAEGRRRGGGGGRGSSIVRGHCKHVRNKER